MELNSESTKKRRMVSDFEATLEPPTSDRTERQYSGVRSACACVPGEHIRVLLTNAVHSRRSFKCRGPRGGRNETQAHQTSGPRIPGGGDTITSVTRQASPPPSDGKCWAIDVIILPNLPTVKLNFVL
ncbi:hypothetical protein B0H10DRAFT_1051565 [Mycena sp. CBHHK59/15]|nr:hypothetical protein B0H10DRAFT_1051565 [Mycena sp. CBHHK59/15]